MVYAFFISHWLLSVFFQSFFQHRYGAHRMFTMGPRTEKVVHLLAYLVQGSSFLSPRAYAMLHREHHAFSDTERDPHSPHYYTNVGSMMWETKKRYHDFLYWKKTPEARFVAGYPEWPLARQVRDHLGLRVLFWVAAYTAFYVAFATTPWLFLLLPIHFVMGPVHGAIVNWCGHKYGYRNFEAARTTRATRSRSTSLTMGELFQNNHHKYGMSPNFAARWFEIDPTWQVMKVLSALKIIKIATPQRAVWPEKYPASAPAQGAKLAA